MQPVRLFTIVAGSVGLAIAAGTLFQPDPAAPSDAETAHAMPEEVPTAPTLAGGVPSLGGLIGPSARGPDPDDKGTEPVPMIASVTEIETGRPEPGLVDGSDPVLAGTTDCAVQVAVTPEPAAMLQISLVAPCDAGESVTIGHGPLTLAGAFGADGRLSMTVPALAAQAEVTVAFLDGRTATQGASVPDFGMFARVIVQWNGPDILDLHAYAGGAGWGEPGHVTAGGPVSAVTGFVTAIATQAETQTRIYTYPAGTAPQHGLILLEAEMAITTQSCGRPFDVRVRMVRDDDPVSLRDIRIDMPSCDMPEGFVLLPDLLPEDLPVVATLN